ncbi:MAG TPA: JAB domain-containing protein [Pseudomonas sp.]|uniref:JAB domain-containing protein n=1 Tax=Pseudomonas sp. TaxID=306 RepID=UPI002B493AD8|nr:JAB domain-containing protein [Pseudomonas sp.]HKS15013.1 JAB domain-containing protein [Pseudomonas sp.]
MQIREWPSSERPREKLMKRGAASLSDAELLAVFLGSGVAGLNVVDLARGLLARFGGLRQFLEADRAEVLREPGVGPVKYSQLQAVLEIGRRHLDAIIVKEPALESASAVRRYLKSMLRHEPSEVFGCLFLDNKHQPLGFETLFRGTINHASVHPREVVRRSLAHNAAAVILKGYMSRKLLHICRAAIDVASTPMRLSTVTSGDVAFFRRGSVRKRCDDTW